MATPRFYRLARHFLRILDNLDFDRKDLFSHIVTPFWGDGKYFLTQLISAKVAVNDYNCCIDREMFM